MIISLREMGQRCKQYRVNKGYYQTDVANDTGYSVENISSFETGRNDNARILLWYFAHGMQPEHLFKRGVENGSEI
jgi:transcriptional regulator with XRE-family HTH domain